MRTILQDFFDDVDDTFIQDHLSDVNHTDDQYRSDNLKILGNELVFVAGNTWGAWINTPGNRMFGYIWLYINNAGSFEFKLIIRRKSSSEHIHLHVHSNMSGSLWIRKDSTNTILQERTDWTITTGWKKINFIIEPDYLEFDMDGETNGIISLYTPLYYDTPALDFYRWSGASPKLNTLLLQEQSEDYSGYSNTANTTITGLTMKEIWERYSEVEFKRTILIKRLSGSGLYEDEYQDIINLTGENLNMFEVCKSISFTLPNDTYSLGRVTVKNAELNFMNLFGKLNDENTIESIFLNFKRNKSLIKIIDSFIDKYTYPGSMGEISVTSFEGFIDDRLSQTTNRGNEKLIITEILTTLLKEVTWGEIKDSLTQTTLDNLIYEIMNREQFTDFFTVSLSNIVPGFNATGIDRTKYEDSKTLLEVFENLSIGHSIFYVRGGVFYYKSNDPTAAVQINFGLSPDRKEKVDKINNGAKTVKDKLYWKDSTETYFKGDRVYNEIYEFDILGITNTTQKQGLLDYVGPRISSNKGNFQLTIPFLPILFLLDRVTLERIGSVQNGSWILDSSKLDEIIFLDPITTLKLTTDQEWKIVQIEHKSKTKTILTLEEIV